MATSSSAKLLAAALTQPERTIYSVKRLMGRGVKDVQDELNSFRFASIHPAAT